MSTIHVKVSPHVRGLFLKAVLAVALFFLNVFFAGSSNLLGDALPRPVSWFLVTITFLDAVILAGYLHTLAYYVIDMEALILITTVAICVVLLTRRAGILMTFLRTVQVLSLVMIVLPIEVYFFDGEAFTIYFASFQVLSHVLPWFSNEDLLLVCFYSLIMTTLLVWMVTRRSKRPS